VLKSYHPSYVVGRPPPPQGCPPGVDPNLWHWFSAVDTDRSGQLSVDELQRALVNGDWSPFNIETVRTMVNMFDTGKLGKRGGDPHTHMLDTCMGRKCTWIEFFLKKKTFRLSK
jgi:hypothetical protein